MKPRTLTAQEYATIKQARAKGFTEYYPGQPVKTLREAVFFLDALDRAERLRDTQAQAQAGALDTAHP